MMREIHLERSKLFMFNLQQAAIGKFKAYMSKFTVAISIVALSVFAWSNSAIFTGNTTANAETIKDLPLVLAVSGSGIADQAEGTFDKAAGAVQRKAGEITDDTSAQAEGIIKQTKGDAKINLGGAENKLDDAKDTVEQKSESIIDSVKDFFD